MRNSALYIDFAGEKGKGVYTKKAIAANTVIEISPVIVLSEEDASHVEQSKLFYYIFEWGETTTQRAVGLGYVSMYNHHSPSNCEYLMDYEAETISIQTLRPIKAGEELTINYSAGWDDWEPVWFEEKKEKHR